MHKKKEKKSSAMENFNWENPFLNSSTVKSGYFTDTFQFKQLLQDEDYRNSARFSLPKFLILNPEFYEKDPELIKYAMGGLGESQKRTKTGEEQFVALLLKSGDYFSIQGESDLFKPPEASDDGTYEDTGTLSVRNDVKLVSTLMSLKNSKGKTELDAREPRWMIGSRHFLSPINSIEDTTNFPVVRTFHPNSVFSMGTLEGRGGTFGVLTLARYKLLHGKFSLVLHLLFPDVKDKLTELGYLVPKTNPRIAGNYDENYKEILACAVGSHKVQLKSDFNNHDGSEFKFKGVIYTFMWETLDDKITVKIKELKISAIGNTKDFRS